jgi:hypothetical protein
MKTYCLALLLCGLPVLLFSQISRSSIDLVGGIEFSYRHLIVTYENDSVNVAEKGKRDQGETGKIQWRAGFNYNRRLGPNVFFKTGLRVASVGYTGLNNTDVRWPDEFDEQGNWTPKPSNPHRIQTNFTYYFLELPLAIRYEFSEKKFTPFVEAGVSPAVVLATQLETITDLETTKGVAFRGITGSDIQLVGIISVGANYKLNENWQLFAQPTFRYHYDFFRGLLDERLWNAGLEMGIRTALR